MISSQTVLPVMTVGVYTIQFFTGFFIPAEIQVGFLYLINLLARMALGRELITGELKPAVLKRFAAGEFQIKKVYLTKTFRVLAIGGLVLIVNAIIHKLGIQFDLLRYSVPTLGVINLIIGIVTKHPVELK